MRYLLSRANMGVLSQVAWSRVLLAFDFDGTLAPIVADRRSASMRARTAELFARACTLYPCAVISGRTKADVTARLGRAPVKYVIGNHGLEPSRELAYFAREAACVAPVLRQALAGCSGVEVEDKRYSLAVHYRRARRKIEARAIIGRAIAELPRPMRLIPGKLVVNVVPQGAPNKGDALLNLRAHARADTALYVGDDITDEDVFVLDQPGRLLTVRIGASRSSAAAYFLRRQGEIDALLAKLSAVRQKGAFLR